MDEFSPTELSCVTSAAQHKEHGRDPGVLLTPFCGVITTLAFASHPLSPTGCVLACVSQCGASKTGSEAAAVGGCFLSSTAFQGEDITVHFLHSPDEGVCEVSSFASE